MCYYNESILKGQMFWYALRSGHFCLFGIASLFNVKELVFSQHHWVIFMKQVVGYK